MLVKKSTKRIHKLSTELANQIAAGEVVERPFSVLKELLENSIDAGSTQIDISIERGGIGLIRVQDNGCGICKEDLELALSQHATSKILSFSDLEGVASFGFRGEALASISGVSRLSLSSYVDGQETAFRIQKEGRGDNFVLSPAPKLSGTIVEVKDLFYNTPARRKFLRSEKTETLYLEEIFKKIALSHPGIAFSYQLNDRAAKRLPACRSLPAETRRINDLCGANFIKTAHFIEAESNGLKLKGWLGSPQYLRAQADLQYFYVNGRNVRDKVVNHATRQAYEVFSDSPGKYPAFILFFDLDPEAVDVNVHPTKHEVRFRETRTVHAFLTYSIQEGLAKAMSIGNSSQHEMVMENLSPSVFTPEVVAEKSVFSGEFLKSYQLQELPKKLDKTETTIALAEPLRDKISVATKAAHFEQKSSFLSEASNPVTAKFNSKLEDSALSVHANTENYLPLTLLAGEFLVVEQSASLILYNIKKMQEILIIQQLKNELKQGLLASKPLLMPIKVELKNAVSFLDDSHFSASFLNSNSHSMVTDADANEKASKPDILKILGFDWSQLGPNSLLIRSAPTFIKKISTEFATMAQEIISLNDVEMIISIIAKYCVISDSLSFVEAVKLLKDYLNADCENSNSVAVPKLQYSPISSKPNTFLNENINRLSSFYRKFSIKDIRILFANE